MTKKIKKINKITSQLKLSSTKKTTILFLWKVIDCEELWGKNVFLFLGTLKSLKVWKRPLKFVFEWGIMRSGRHKIIGNLFWWQFYHLILELLKLTFELHHVKFGTLFLHPGLLLRILHFVQLLLQQTVKKLHVFSDASERVYATNVYLQCDKKSFNCHSWIKNKPS